MTTVINLLGGSGLGKSTTAAAVFSELKLLGYSAELVTEFVKQWAWAGRKITALDQPFIFGHQSQAEAQLYGKVDYIVTDSPLLLCSMYEEYYNRESIIKPAVLNFLKAAEKHEVKHHNFLLKRNKAFDTRGRYETEDQARAVDAYLENYLKNDVKVDYTVVDTVDRGRVSTILEKLNLGPPERSLDELNKEAKRLVDLLAKPTIELGPFTTESPYRSCPECGFIYAKWNTEIHACHGLMIIE